MKTSKPSQKDADEIKVLEENKKSTKKGKRQTKLRKRGLVKDVKVEDELKVT